MLTQIFNKITGISNLVKFIYLKTALYGQSFFVYA